MYFIDETKFTVDLIVQRVLDTNLIPSLEMLKDDIEIVMVKLKKSGVSNLSDLRAALKTKAKLLKTSAELDINENYLQLLRREIEGWIAKVRKMDEFEWIDEETIKNLKKIGIEDSECAYRMLSTKKSIEKKSEESGVSEALLEEIHAISDLLRIRWLSPHFTRVLYESGYTISKIQKAEPHKLSDEIDTCNREKKYFKGIIGERDVRRIIFESQFV